MKILNKTLKVLLLGTTLMTSAKAADLTFTVAAYTALADKIAVGVPEVDKSIEVAGVLGSGLDKGYLGTVAASSESYILLDGSNKLKALAIIGGKWCTFESAVLSAISATGQIHLTQTKEDGVDDSAKKLTINLTKTTGATITPTALGTWLKTALTASTKSFSASALKSLSAPAAGWTATALFQLAAGTNVAGDALAATLDPIAFTLTAPVTPAAGGTAVNYTATLADISPYNVALGDHDPAEVVMFINGSNILTLAMKPGLIDSRGTSIIAGLVSDATALERRRLKLVEPFTYQTLGTAVHSIHSQLAINPVDQNTNTLEKSVNVILTKIAGSASSIEGAVQSVMDSWGASDLSGVVFDKARSYIVDALFTSADCGCY